jgi:glucosamine--fructose-6-phosphate aminotransferase (isomerizing)
MTIPGFIREQPEALDRCLAAAEAFVARWRPGSWHTIALVGSGSSFNALTIARPQFVAAGHGPVLAFEPGDFPAELPQLGERALVIVLSQSGASTTSIAAVRAAIEAGVGVLAITASGEAALARLGAPALIMAVGDEPVGPKTKGFVGSLATLFVVARALGATPSTAMRGGDLAPLIEPARRMAEDLVPSLAGVDQIIVAGRRSNHGVALEASLKIAEMAGIPSAAFPTEELLHGRLHGMTERSVAFVVAEGEAEVAQARLAGAAMERRGCRLVIVDPARMPWRADAALPASPWNALGLVLPFQWLAVLLAEARGLRPETMRHGSLSRELDIKTSAQS